MCPLAEPEWVRDDGEPTNENSSAARSRGDRLAMLGVCGWGGAGGGATMAASPAGRPAATCWGVARCTEASPGGCRWEKRCSEPVSECTPVAMVVVATSTAAP